MTVSASLRSDNRTISVPSLNFLEKIDLLLAYFILKWLYGALSVTSCCWDRDDSSHLKSLKDAGIVNSLAAGRCLLKAVNVIKTRYAHQITTAVLDILRKKSFHQQWNIFIFRRMDFVSTE